jgi:ethanolamine utilization protein EutN
VKTGIVTGVVWASKKAKELDGCRLQIVKPVMSDGQIKNTQIVAADPLGIAGIGDKVLYVTSTDAAEAFKSGKAPVNASIVGLVDEVS